MEVPCSDGSEQQAPATKRLAEDRLEPNENKRTKSNPPGCDAAASGPTNTIKADTAAGSTAGLPSTSSKPATPLKFAVSDDPGRRITMEDAWQALLDARLASHGSACTSGSSRISFFGVFDGHAGRNCAAYAAEHVHANAMAAGLVPVKVASGQEPLDIKAARRAITEGFIRTDTSLLELCKEKNWQDGAAAVCVWVINDTVLVANVGDCKCVLARRSDKDGSRGQLRGLTLTKDHLAIYPDERTRIQKVGGSVSADGRLNGRLQIARSFGDIAFKKSGASALPSIQVLNITERDDFLVCACDGFWSVFDAQGAVEFVAAALADGLEEKLVVTRAVLEAVRERKCTDNVTLLLIRFCHTPE